jgi:hypothetical protein
MLEQKPANISLTDEWLAEHKGYYVIRLADCEGIPNYSNGGMYEGADETSFRGSFLQVCTSFLDENTLNTAWTDFMSPSAAVAYGKKLLALAQGDPLGSVDESSEEPVEEQRSILEAAGRWYIYWGERGNPIGAYY